MNTGHILIVDDDDDDKQLLEDAWKDLKYPNKLIFFKNGFDVLNYLQTNEQVPFLILCDVNIPKMDGFELKEKIWNDGKTRYKSIPFVFWSSMLSNAQIQRAYDLGVNGFFLKDSNFNDLKKSLVDIVNYWAKSKVPV
jgi:CheY-like chemotaxis protein